jgi:hypothetical protein
MMPLSPVHLDLGGAAGAGSGSHALSFSATGSETVFPVLGADPARQIFQLLAMSSMQLATVAPALKQLTEAGLQVSKEVKEVKQKVGELEQQLDVVRRESEFKFCTEPPLRTPSLVLAKYLAAKQYIDNRATTVAFFCFKTPGGQDAVLVHPGHLAHEVRTQVPDGITLSETDVRDMLKRRSAESPDAATLVYLLGPYKGLAKIKLDMTASLVTKHGSAVLEAETHVHEQWSRPDAVSSLIWAHYEDAVAEENKAAKKRHLTAVKNFFKLTRPDELLVLPLAKIDDLVKFRLQAAADEIKLELDVDAGAVFADFKFGRARIQLRDGPLSASKKRKAPAAAAAAADSSDEELAPMLFSTDIEDAPAPSAGAGAGSGSGSAMFTRLAAKRQKVAP